MKLRRTATQQHLEDQLNSYLGETCSNLTIEGLCHGFTLVFSKMHQIGKLDWWLKVLDAIASWDGSHEELENWHDVPDSDDPYESLEDLFERALTYVYFYSGKFDYENGPTPFQQQFDVRHDGEGPASNMVFNIPHSFLSTKEDADESYVEVLETIVSYQFSAQLICLTRGNSNNKQVSPHIVANVITPGYIGIYNSSTGIFCYEEGPMAIELLPNIIAYVNFINNYPKANETVLICNTAEDQAILKRLMRYCFGEACRREAKLTNETGTSWVKSLYIANQRNPLALNYLLSLGGANEAIWELCAYDDIRGHLHRFRPRAALNYLIPDELHQYLASSSANLSSNLESIYQAIVNTFYLQHLIADLIQTFSSFFIRLFMTAHRHAALSSLLLSAIYLAPGTDQSIFEKQHINWQFIKAQLFDLDRKWQFLEALLLMSRVAPAAALFFKELLNDNFIRKEEWLPLLSSYIQTAARNYQVIDETLLTLYIETIFSSAESLEEALSCPDQLTVIVIHLAENYYSNIHYWPRLCSFLGREENRQKADELIAIIKNNPRCAEAACINLVISAENQTEFARLCQESNPHFTVYLTGILWKKPIFIPIAIQYVGTPGSVSESVVTFLENNRRLLISALDLLPNIEEKALYARRLILLIKSNSIRLRARDFCEALLNYPEVIKKLLDDISAKDYHIIFTVLLEHDAFSPSKELIKGITQDFIEKHPDEFHRFLTTILPKMTSTFTQPVSLPGLIAAILLHDRYHPALMMSLLQPDLDFIDKQVIRSLPNDTIRQLLTSGQQVFSACSLRKLIFLFNQLKDAPNDPLNPYRFLCKERTRYGYGRTNTWQRLIKTLQNAIRDKSILLRQRSPAITAVLQFTASRLSFMVFSKGSAEPKMLAATEEGPQEARYILTVQEPSSAFFMLVTGHTESHPVLSQAIELLCSPDTPHDHRYSEARMFFEENTSGLVHYLLQKDINLYKALFRLAESGNPCDIDSHPIVLAVRSYLKLHTGSHAAQASSAGACASATAFFPGQANHYSRANRGFEALVSRYKPRADATSIACLEITTLT